MKLLKNFLIHLKTDIKMIWNQWKVASVVSYIDIPGWIKNNKATINLINQKDRKYFQYAVTVALNYEEIKKDLQRITKIKSFINKYNWEGINFPS